MDATLPHIGCIGNGCPICVKLGQPGYEGVAAHLAGKPALPVLPCVHLVGPTGEQLATGCRGCGSQEATTLLYRCDLHGECSPTVKDVPGVTCCSGCRDRAYVAPSRTVRLDRRRLIRGEADAAFNASVCDFKGRRLLCYRTGWAGAQLHITELGDDLQPRGESMTLTGLEIDGISDHGREDPRLFVHQGRLHVSCIGVTLDAGNIITHQCYGRLRDDLSVERAWHASYHKRQMWEKNWALFSWQNELFAIYSINPHTVLHLVGGDAYPFAETISRATWGGGHLRGGAAPVRVGDEYWHWFHGRIEAGQTGPRGERVKLQTYNLGVYTFEARPPFRVRRMTPAPLVWGDAGTVPAGFDKAVIFPCGAVLEGDRWLVSAGVHDQWVEIFEFDSARVERVMVPA